MTPPKSGGMAGGVHNGDTRQWNQSPQLNANRGQPHESAISISPDTSRGQYDIEATGTSPQNRRSTRRRPSGGPNSLDEFARSWQRAAYFQEVMPQRSSFVLTEPEDEGDESDQPLLTRPAPLSTWVGAGDGYSENAIEGAGETILQNGYNYGSSYGSIDTSRINQSARQRAEELHQQHHMTEPNGHRYGEQEPLLVKQVQHEDGTKETIIVGKSTVPQTVFNSVNVLIGIGLLSLPLGLKYAGWLIGIPFLLFSAAVTAYTAKILSLCMDVDSTLVTYADLAYISFGNRARVTISILFCVELIGACVALVVLFADSVDALIPGLGTLWWKLICGAILIPMSFVPLRFLSVTSFLGIFCCTLIVVIVIFDGFIKSDFPGSLREPATTYLLPQNWAAVPLSFGLIMSPWGGHGVFPNIYRDMRHPQKYGKSLWSTYIFTFSLDLAMSVAGWLMFGDEVRDEITSNILLMSGYPKALSICIVISIAIIPLTKVPLSSRPIVETIEVLCGLRKQAIHIPHDEQAGISEFAHNCIRAAIRIFNIAVIVFISIVFPFFDRIMALIGSSLCITICVIFPIAFYLKIFNGDISLKERIIDWVLIVCCTVIAVWGTVVACVPKEQLGVS